MGLSAEPVLSASPIPSTPEKKIEEDPVLLLSAQVRQRLTMSPSRSSPSDSSNRSTEDVEAAPVVSKKKRPVSKRPQAANDKAKPKKNRVQKKVIQIDTSEDDVDFSDSDDEVPPPPPKEQAEIVRAGRGGRARINYALQESESEESDGFIVDDDESDESDESDF